MTSFLSNDIYCFLRSPICQTQSIVELRFGSVKIKQLRQFGRFYLFRVSTPKRSPKRMQLSLIVGTAFGFWLISDLPISGWSGFPHFRFSLFPGFNIPVYVSTCIWLCRAGWIEGLFEVVALKTQFSDPKWDLPSWFSDSWANFHLWTVVLPSNLARNVTQFHLLWLFAFGLLAWDSKTAAYQQFLKHIYWNFIDSSISGIGIWFNLWVSASNELGKPYFWQNLLEVDPLR